MYFSWKERKISTFSSLSLSLSAVQQKNIGVVELMSFVLNILPNRLAFKGQKHIMSKACKTGQM